MIRETKEGTGTAEDAVVTDALALQGIFA